MRLHKKAKPVIDWSIRRKRRRKQAGKHTSGYYLEFPQPSKIGQHANSEIKGTPLRYSMRRSTPTHIIIRFSKDKILGKLSRATRDKDQVTYIGKPIRLTADLSAETLLA